MNYSRSKLEVMQNLGMGLSVDSLCKKCEITYDQLCELAQEHTDLYHELKKWYKRYDFVPKCNDVPAPEGVEFEHEEELKLANSLETKEKAETNPKKTKKKVV